MSARKRRKRQKAAQAQLKTSVTEQPSRPQKGAAGLRRSGMSWGVAGLMAFVALLGVAVLVLTSRSSRDKVSHLPASAPAPVFPAPVGNAPALPSPLPSPSVGAPASTRDAPFSSSPPPPISSSVPTVPGKPRDVRIAYTGALLGWYDACG
jgi:hypothetical protein